MPTLLVGSAYGISSGLIILGFTTDIIPEDQRYALLLAWAVIGILLALVGLLKAKA